MDDFTQDIIARARWARDNNGHPKPVWSTGEQLAVAFVLDDREFFAASGYTRRDAILRIAGDTGVADVNAWLRAVRDRVQPGPTPRAEDRPDDDQRDHEGCR